MSHNLELERNMDLANRNMCYAKRNMDLTNRNTGLVNRNKCYAKHRLLTLDDFLREKRIWIDLVTLCQILVEKTVRKFWSCSISKRVT